MKPITGDLNSRLSGAGIARIDLNSECKLDPYVFLSLAVPFFNTRLVLFSPRAFEIPPCRVIKHSFLASKAVQSSTICELVMLRQYVPAIRSHSASLLL
jgi:hypothetical protein